MIKLPNIPDIVPSERLPLVVTLLEIIENLVEELKKQDATIDQLKDEIAILKGEKTRPKFKPSKMDKEAGKKDAELPQDDTGKPKRPGSAKRHKTEEVIIHNEVKVPPELIPEGSRFKGYQEYVVQDLIIRADNTRYLLECWQTPEGKLIVGKLPPSVNGHYGATLRATALYLHHHGRVTQQLLREMFQAFGVDISTGQVNALLTEGHEAFMVEKSAILQTGLEVSDAITVDDTGSRHQGKNGFTTHIGNEYFAWFASSPEKNRLNFLSLLRAGESELVVNDDALTYMKIQGLPQDKCQQLQNHSLQKFDNEVAWQNHLARLGFTRERHIRIASEAVQVGSLLRNDLWKTLAIISDDAGQFAVPMMIHGLCWVHAERLIHKLTPFNENHRLAQQNVRGEIWTFYSDLKNYKLKPDEEQKVELSARFDAIFTQKTEFFTLNQVLKRLHNKKSELLLVLDYPTVPLHTNGSERDIRAQVIKGKVSGGTRSKLGQQCRDTFLTVNKTCRKLGVSFWCYLIDRISGTKNVPPLQVFIREKAMA